MLSIFFLISSCSKSGNDPKKSIDPVVDPCRIVTVEVINGTPVTYSYDSQGRVSQTTNLFGFGTGTFTYSTYNVTFKNAKDGSTYNFVTDAQGRIVSDKYDTYKYDAEGYLIEKNDGSVTSEFVLSYSNGNLVKVVRRGEETSTISYFDERNQDLMGYESPLFSSLLFNMHTFSGIMVRFTGKQSKNLVRSITTVKKDPDTNKEVEFRDTYTYQKDSDGKVIAMNIDSEPRTGIHYGVSAYRFTYNCK